MFDAVEIIIGWILGVVTIYIGRHISVLGERTRIGPVLVQEIKSNQGFLCALSALRGRIDENGVVSDADGKSIFNLLQARWLKPFFLQETIFLTTLRDHGLLGKRTLEALHQFYAELRQIRCFIDASEDEKCTDAQRIGFARDAVDNAATTLERLDKNRLLKKLEAIGKVTRF